MKNGEKKYRVIIDQIRNPSQDVLDISQINLDIYATNINEAASKAWKAVTINPEQYEIVLIEAVLRIPRRPEPF